MQTISKAEPLHRKTKALPFIAAHANSVQLKQGMKIPSNAETSIYQGIDFEVPSGVKNALFICTSNYYRSPFAQAVFNHLSIEENIHWRAYSRGINCSAQENDISDITLKALQARGIPPNYAGTRPHFLTEGDLAQADLIVAMDRSEHLPMIRSKFPTWSNLVVFWEEPDINSTNSEAVLHDIEIKVKELIWTIRKVALSKVAVH